jgi:hypothetical protein
LFGDRDRRTADDRYDLSLTLKIRVRGVHDERHDHVYQQRQHEGEEQ